MNLDKLSKYQKLFLGVLFDGIGYLSFAFPLIDIVWAPLSAWIMTKLYKGRSGKVAAVISFVEEALPWMDVIPTFSLMWLYTFVLTSEGKKLE